MASAVGGLLTLVEPGSNGRLVAQRDADVWADAVEEVTNDNFNCSMSNSAVLLSQRYTWRSAAESLDALVVRLIEAGLVRC